MKKAWITILGIINLLVATAAVTYLCYATIRIGWEWGLGLPILIMAIVTLTAGIFTLREKSFGCGFISLIIFGAVLIFFIILFVVAGSYR